MKTFKQLIVAIAALLVFQSINAQSDKSERTIGVKTQSIKVYGTCDMVNDALKQLHSVDGIKSAEWNLNMQTLAITYSVFKKNAPDNVQRKVASHGNDTEKYKADETTYMNLPECCIAKPNLKLKFSIHQRYKSYYHL